MKRSYIAGFVLASGILTAACEPPDENVVDSSHIDGSAVDSRMLDGSVAADSSFHDASFVDSSMDDAGVDLLPADSGLGDAGGSDSATDSGVACDPNECEGTWSLSSTINYAPPLTNYFGSSVALSADGNTLAVGDREAGTFYLGGVMVYQKVNGAWTDGVLIAPRDERDFGSSVSLSADGRTLAVGDPYAAGHASVFSFDGNSWSAGIRLERPATIEAFGRTVALSPDGNSLAVGDDEGLGGHGGVTVYTFDGVGWSWGTSLAAPTNSRRFGSSLAFSHNGRLLGIGDPDGGLASGGAAHIFALEGSSWSLQTTVVPPNYCNSFGHSVSLSADGSTFAVGDPEGSQAGAGTATIYAWNGMRWLSGRSIARPAGTADFGRTISLSANGRSLAVRGSALSSSDAQIYRWNGSAWSAATLVFGPEDPLARVASMAFSSNGGTLVLGYSTSDEGAVRSFEHH